MAEQLASPIKLGLASLDPTSIEYGLDVILSLLQTEKPYDQEFPWRISTYLTGGRQIVVNNKAEAIARFKQSKLLDCRISAYPYPVPEVGGINAQIPYFFLSDLDRKGFKTTKALEQCLQQSLKNYETKLHGAKPIVLWTGGGYHLLQTLDADIVLETQNIFKEFIPFKPSRELMRYAEMLMTNGNADPAHNNSVAFGNCMIRIPGSYNSKYIHGKPSQSEVKIVQRWDGYKPNIRYMLEGLWEHLIQLRNNEISERARFEMRHPYDVTPPSQPQIQSFEWDWGWVERLLQKPLVDFRRYCITFVLVPYFLNIKRLSDLDTLDKITAWLEKCRSVHRLDFNGKSRIKYDIKSVRKLQRNRRFIRPSIPRLKAGNPALYALLQKERVIY
jgi:Primase X